LHPGRFPPYVVHLGETLSPISTNTLSYTSAVLETPPNQTSNLGEALAAVVTVPTSQTVNLSEASAAIATASTSQTLVPSQTLNPSATLDINEIDANNYPCRTILHGNDRFRGIPEISWKQYSGERIQRPDLSGSTRNQQEPATGYGHRIPASNSWHFAAGSDRKR
jgi:hypothetical protein